MTPQRPDDIRRISLKTLKLENSEKSKDCFFLNVLQPKEALENDFDNDLSVKQIAGENYIGVKVTSKSYIETFLFSQSGQISHEDIQSSSKWISVLKDRKGKLIKSTGYDAV